MINEINDYIKRKKKWLYFVPGWLIALFFFIQLQRFKLGEPISLFINPFYTANFGVHELAHVFASGFPDIITAAAGSFSEILLGLLFVFGAFKTRAYFTATLSCLWLMLALRSTGMYMSDAVDQKLPLVSIAGDVTLHDWKFIFEKLGWLDSAPAIGGFVQLLGTLVGLAGLVFGGWLIYRIGTKHPLQSDQTGAKTHSPAFAAHEIYPMPKSTPDKPGLTMAQKAPTGRSVPLGELYPSAYRGVLAEKPLMNRQDTTKK